MKKTFNKWKLRKECVITEVKMTCDNYESYKELINMINNNKQARVVIA